MQSILTQTKRKQWAELQVSLEASQTQSASGAKLMLTYRKQPRQIIEDAASLWLLEQKSLLYAHLGWLALLSVASPLLGLLGTVLGMIEAFQAIATHPGAVSPAVLANGLQKAMLTTAFGLCIAIPSLITGHAFKILANNYLLSLENLLNQMLLCFQNIDVKEVRSSAFSYETVSSLKEQQV